MHRSVRPLTALIAVCLLAGCVRYRPQHVSVEGAAEAVAPAPSGPLAFEEAVRLLVERHPELRATRAEIAAVNLRPGPMPVEASTQVMDGRVTETMVGGDLLSLLGIGPRAAETALARAIRDERVRQHHERARDLVAELAQAYAVERVLRGLPEPASGLDVDAFERAGLASRATLAAARAVAAQAQAEARVTAAQLADARRRIAYLVGAGPDVAIEPVEVPEEWPSVAEPDRERLVLARGDLQTLLAAWCVADRRYRYHVARQLPNLGIGLGGNVDLQVPMQLVRIELPLDAPAEARAAGCAREAAYHRLQAGVLAALHEARSAQLEEEAARARFAAALERQRAVGALLEARRALLETDPQALGDVVLVAGETVDALRQVRETAVALARARAQAARAAGWPTPAQIGGVR